MKLITELRQMSAWRSNKSSRNFEAFLLFTNCFESFDQGCWTRTSRSFLFPFRRRIEITMRASYSGAICMNRIYMKSLSRFIFRVAVEEITASIIILRNYHSPSDVTLRRMDEFGSSARRWSVFAPAIIFVNKYSRIFINLYLEKLETYDFF